MANRPVFIVNLVGKKFVDVEYIDFDWFPGFSKTQKQKSIESLHSNFNKISNNKKILEISSKSELELGVNLSSFNLEMLTQKSKQSITVECAFQGSKVFEKGGPYQDLYFVSSKEAKKDPRIKQSGKLIGFKFFGQEWQTEPKTLFYDWLYLNALNKKSQLANQVTEYSAFTDIEFNPQKSINCQAYSVALFVSLHKRGILQKVLSSREEYMTHMGIKLFGYKAEQLNISEFDKG